MTDPTYSNSLIPSFINDPVVDKDGMLTQSWRDIFTQLFNILQQNSSQEGTVIPSQSATNIGVIQTNAMNGTMLYDSTNNQAKVVINGVFKTITTS